MNGAEALVRALKAMGVPFIAALCGNGLDPLLAAADQAALPIIDTRNEQAASYLADAYARLTGRLGVCAVSSGIAHVNALAGVANAWYDGAPLLLISGSSPSEGLGRGVFQDMDQVTLAQPLCKHAELVTRADRIPQALRAAVGAATSGRPGPVHLTITVDALDGELAAENEAMYGQSREGDDAPDGLSDDENARALALLAEAQQPLIVAGSGVFYAGAGEALQAFTRRTAIPVVTPIWDRGVVDAAWDTYVGVVGAASGEPDLLAQADLLLLLGAAVDYRVRYLDSPPLRSDCKAVWVGRGASPPCALNLAMDADIGVVLRRWTEAWTSAPHAAWLERARDAHRRFYQRWQQAEVPADGDGSMDGGALVRVLAAEMAAIDPEPVFLVDGGNIGQWAHMLWAGGRYPRHWLTCGASGVVGWGVPGAMAARLAYPERRVLLLSGDGSVGFGLAEFESAARQGIPFVAVVADDSAWGIVASGHDRRYAKRLSCELGPADYAGAAAALGATGVHARTARELREAVREAWARSCPTLIQVPIEPGGPTDG